MKSTMFRSRSQRVRPVRVGADVSPATDCSLLAVMMHDQLIFFASVFFFFTRNPVMISTLIIFSLLRFIMGYLGFRGDKRAVPNRSGDWPDAGIKE